MRPKRPAGGKAKPGMTFVAAKHRRDFELTSCVNDPVADCGAVGALADSGSNGHALAAGRRREFPRLRRGTDEPDEGVLHVRVCGGSRG